MKYIRYITKENQLLLKDSLELKKLKSTEHDFNIKICVYNDKLDDIVKEYNNTYHKAIKMKPVDVKNNTYIDCSKEVNNKDPKFKVGDHVRISRY